jgi:hypothetical protein
MKNITVAICFSLVGVSAYAMKPCNELKAEIDAKLRAKGVKDFALEVIPVDKLKEELVVGSCDGGTKKIVYKRTY